MLHAIFFGIAIIGIVGFILCWLVAVFIAFSLMTSNQDWRAQLWKRLRLAFLAGFASWLLAAIGSIGANAFGSG